MEQGLAQQSADGGQQQQVQQAVMQIAQLLKQGVSPEELMAKGVPEKLIDMAMKMVGMQDQDNDMDEGRVNGSVQDQGLAQMTARQ